MKKLILLLLSACSLNAQVGPPPATPEEVAAGTDRYKYLTPYSAAVSGISSNGITAVGATNIIEAMRQDAGFDVGGNAATATTAATVTSIAGHLNPQSLTNFYGGGADLTQNPEFQPFSAAKIGAGRFPRTLIFMDNAIGGDRFYADIVATLEMTGTRGGACSISGGYLVEIGDGSGYEINAASGTDDFWQAGWLGLGSSTESFTNSTLPIPTTQLSVNCWKLNGGGTYTVSTQSYEAGALTAKGTVFEFSADNGGAIAPYQTNFYLPAEANLVASITHTGTTNRLHSLGQFSTNAGRFVFDIWAMGSMSWEKCLTNSTQSNTLATFLANYDSLIVADLGTPWVVATGAESLISNFGLTTDLIYAVPQLATNLSYSDTISTRSNYFRMGAVTGRPVLDIGYLWLNGIFGLSANLAALAPLYAVDGLHSSTILGNKLNAQTLIRKMRWLPDDLKSVGFIDQVRGTNFHSVTPFTACLSSSGSLNNTSPNWSTPGYWKFGSRYISAFLMSSNAPRQVGFSIPSEKMIGRKNITLRQYWLTTNAQPIVVQSRILKASALPVIAGATATGGTDGATYTQTLTGTNILVATFATQTFTEAGKSGDIYTVAGGWGTSGTLTNAVEWLGAEMDCW